MFQRQKLIIQKNPFIPFFHPNERSINLARLIDRAELELAFLKVFFESGCTQTDASLLWT